MRITWDKKAKAVYIYLREAPRADWTKQLSEDLWLDFSAEIGPDLPIGIEILNVEELPVVEEI